MFGGGGGDVKITNFILTKLLKDQNFVGEKKLNKIAEKNMG